jgi:WhiB family redox-sensing transcriptional regulator
MELININDLNWTDDAACTTASNPDIFFPPRNKELYKPIADEAKGYCFGIDGKTPPCPVRKECLWYALESDEQHGIWGGLSHRERNALVRKWQRQYKSSMTLKEYIFRINKKDK